MELKKSERGLWESKLGFIFAAAGSAIGLGNIWRFPYITGQNGGAAFVFIYIFFIIILGLPIMISELTIGRKTGKNPIGAFRKLAPKSVWKYVGVLGVITGTLILSFYSVIAGYTLGYFFKALAGDFNHLTTGIESQQIFAGFTSDVYISIGLAALFVGLTGIIVMKGISTGIERWSKIFMPILFVLLVLLVLRSVTLKGAMAGLDFYLNPDFSKVTITTFVMALGQALFSLSLGGGGMMTYGSYLSKKNNIVTSAYYISLFDTLIAIIAGLIIFPALFSMNLDPAGGPGLIFETLPTIFIKIPGGMLFGAAIFLLLTIAALTTTISLLEIPVSYLVDEKGWSRKKATGFGSLIVFLLAVPSALSMGGSNFFTHLPYINLSFLDLIVIVFANYSLVIGAFLIAVFVGYKWGVTEAINEIEQEGVQFKLQKTWKVLIRYVSPVAVMIILAYIVITGNYF